MHVSKYNSQTTALGEPLDDLVDSDAIRHSVRTETLLKYDPCSRRGGIVPFPPKVLATFAGTAATLRTESSQSTFCLAESLP